MANLSERLNQLREERNLLKKDIARDSGLALRTYLYYETGERVPDVNNLIKLCEYFGVSADYILGLSEIKERR